MTQDYTESSGNVFKDLGCNNPDEKLAKAELVFIINRIIKERKLTQKEAAKVLGVDQPKISALKNGKISGFSIERLFLFLGILGQQIDITIKEKGAMELQEESIHVAYA